MNTHEDPPQDLIQKMRLWTCVLHALDVPELIVEFNRIYGRKLGVVNLPKNAFEAMVDKATGFDPYASSSQNDDMRAFVEFVDEFVFKRIPWKPGDWVE